MNKINRILRKSNIPISMILIHLQLLHHKSTISDSRTILNSKRMRIPCLILLRNNPKKTRPKQTRKMTSLLDLISVKTKKKLLKRAQITSNFLASILTKQITNKRYRIINKKNLITLMTLHCLVILRNSLNSSSKTSQLRVKKRIYWALRMTKMQT